MGEDVGGCTEGAGHVQNAAPEVSVLALPAGVAEAAESPQHASCGTWALAPSTCHRQQQYLAARSHVGPPCQAATKFPTAQHQHAAPN